jgi:8-oxo-dGTP diphosphatase
MNSFQKYALCIIRNNKLLVQEEDGVEYYTLPGGKAEKEEGAIQALCRKTKEELGIELDIATLRFLGKFEDIAGVKPDSTIRVDLYQGDFQGQLRPGSGVKRIIWFGKNDDWNKLTPVTKNKIMPVLLQKGLLT